MTPSQPDPSPSQADHSLFRMLMLLSFNALIALLVPLFAPIWGEPWDYLSGFLIGFVAITLFDRAYGRRCYRTTIFLFYVLWEILVSNVSLAIVVLRPRLDLDPGIVGIPLTVTSDIEITVLASVITLTPGTLSVDLVPDANGRQVLYVHSLRLGDEEHFRTEIQNGFERMILQISRGE
ncbi:MAG: Na+/H+ antiporter subunit E [Caldilineaceae bacterium]|nr:Na+/H+ antiporter subunit E [Caldilineaceae bacterium]